VPELLAVVRERRLFATIGFCISASSCRDLFLHPKGCSSLQFQQSVKFLRMVTKLFCDETGKISIL
jgi:hypothetical protein